MQNWGYEENSIMRGYIKKAVYEWNLAYPGEAIDEQTKANLLQALRWATDDMTAAEAAIAVVKGGPLFFFVQISAPCHHRDRDGIPAPERAYPAHSRH